jgi:hypothetical protein
MTSAQTPERTIVMADDSDDDFILLHAAFRKAGLAHKLIHVLDGEDAIKYLQGGGTGSCHS